MKKSSSLLWGLTLLAIPGAIVVNGNLFHGNEAGGTLINTVRTATEPYRVLGAAEAAGYGLFHGCASGAQEGAMGVHFVNADLVGDGVLDATKPEALLYEYRNGKPQLVGVEFVVIAEAWHEHDEAPPVLAGQLFNYVSSPNRYGIPAFYELHVWAWKPNPLGTFADWNPRVSCDAYALESGASTSNHDHASDSSGP